MLLLADIPSLSWEEALLRIVVAATLGGAVGIERELRDHDAGFRTHMLVAIGSALFTIVSAYAFRDFLVGGGAVVRADPTRIAAQIVTGIGFLGAGAIIRQGLSVRGLTTAATLWVVAAIGMAAGAGYYGGALITTAVVLISLWPLRILARMGTTRFRSETGMLAAQLASGASPGPLLDEDAGIRRLALEVDVAVAARGDLVRRLAELDQVVGARWGR